MDSSPHNRVIGRIAILIGVVILAHAAVASSPSDAPEPLPASTEIPVAALPAHTGTIFADFTSWGRSSGSVFVGRDPEFGAVPAGGWLRFDLSSIPDDVTVISVLLQFTVDRDRGGGTEVAFVELSTDPVLLRNSSRWRDLEIGKAFLRRAAIQKGDWSLELGPAGAKSLQKLLTEDWFAVGIRPTGPPETSVFVSGWDSAEAQRPRLTVQYLIPPKILSVSWEKPLIAREGETVAMNAEVQGFPITTLATWEIWDDGLFRDRQVVRPNLQNYGVQELDGRFFIRAEWVSDWIYGERGNAEYYINVCIGSTCRQSSKNGDAEMIVSRGADLIPPAPSPMTFATPPYNVSSTAIRMVATEAIDEDRSGVEYSFVCVHNGGNGSDSGWVEDPMYVDTELIPDSQYGYRLIARDQSPAHNATTYSEIGYAWTTANPPEAPLVKATSPHSVTLTISANDNPDHTIYAIWNATTVSYVAADGTFSGAVTAWQTATKWNQTAITGLAPDTVYSFSVTATSQKGIPTKASRVTVVKTDALGPDLSPDEVSASIHRPRKREPKLLGVAVVANHPTAGKLSGTWSLSWIWSRDDRLGNADDRLMEKMAMDDSFLPGQARTYTRRWPLPPEFNLSEPGFIGVLLSDMSKETNDANNALLQPITKDESQARVAQQ